MKQPEDKEINEATFQISSPRHYSHGAERKLRSCASQVLNGVPIEEACERAFGRQSEALMEEIRDFVGKITRETTERNYVSNHRSLAKTRVLGVDESTTDRTTKEKDISRRVRNDF